MRSDFHGAETSTANLDGCVFLLLDQGDVIVVSSLTSLMCQDEAKVGFKIVFKQVGQFKDDMQKWQRLYRV